MRLDQYWGFSATLAAKARDILLSFSSPRWVSKLTVTGMQSTAKSAAEAVNKINERLKEITELVKGHPGAPKSIKSTVESVTKEIGEIRAQLVGTGRGRRGGGRGRTQPLQSRIKSLKSELIGSQSLPTTIQSARQRKYVKELNDVVTQVNKILDTTMLTLHKQLSANNVWPKLSDPIKPVVPR